MTKYNSLNVNLSNSQLNKLKSVIKNETGLVLRLSLNVIGDNETNFLHKSLLTNGKVKNLHKALSNNLSNDIKLSKTKLSEMVQLGGFLGRLLSPLLKTGLSLIKDVIKPLAKSVLIPSGLTGAASAEAAGIHENILGSGSNTTTLIISNDDIIHIVKFLEDSGLFFKGTSETIQNEAKEQKGGFLSMLLGTLGASLTENILAGKGINRAGEMVVRAGYGN